jgi:hypothetical protein
MFCGFNCSPKFLSASFLFLFAAGLFGGCRVPVPGPPLVETLAVLPFDNDSNDLNAPDILQRYVYLALKPSVYKVIDINEVNAKLESVGIVDGGQLVVVDPVKLGRDLGVHALMFGVVTHFDYVNIGFYRHRKVGLELRLVDVATGETIWEKSGQGYTPMVAFDADDAKKEFTKGVADQMAEKMLKSPLDDEARVAAIRTLTGLPGFYFTQFAHDEQTNVLRDVTRDVIRDQIYKK